MKTKNNIEVSVKIRVSKKTRTIIQIEKAKNGGSMIDAADRLVRAGVIGIKTK